VPEAALEDDAEHPGELQRQRMMEAADAANH